MHAKGAAAPAQPQVPQHTEEQQEQHRHVRHQHHVMPQAHHPHHTDSASSHASVMLSSTTPQRINLQKLAQWADDASRQEITEQLLHQALEIQRLDDIAAVLTVRNWK